MENARGQLEMADHVGVAIDLLLSVRTLVALVGLVTGATAVSLAGHVLLTGGETTSARWTEAVAPATAPRAPAVTAPPGLSRALRLLHRWDVARADAYATGDPGRLGGLYAPGSPARTADLALHERYAASGVRVRALRMQLLAVELLEATPTRLRLLVTDRVHGATAEGPSGEVPLRVDEPSTRVVVLVSEQPGGTWRVSAVRPRPGR